MIYSKKANFPYPVLTNHSCEYADAEFEFDVMLSENTDVYRLEVEYKISSEFIRNLLSARKARLILIIKSKDNQFHILDSHTARPAVEIPKSRLSIGSRTVLQLMVQAVSPVSFLENEDLNPFFDSQKAEISVDKGMALAFSNLVIFDGSQNKPYDLFEKKVDPNLASDIEVQLGDETILILYKTEEMQFLGLPGSSELNYPYLYIGLQKALISFLSHYTDSIEDTLDLTNVEPLSALDEKLYSLMRAKGIPELSFDTVDQVIYLISDNLLKRYTSAIRGMSNGS